MEYGKRIESLEEIKKIQVDVLRAFHQFCTEKGINYSLAYGTLLGAIRHKGYIPWDDDIDICMLRADYEKLENLFPENYQDAYGFYTLNRNLKWNRSYGKFFNTKTVEVESSNDNVGIGVSIDIFPIDDVPDTDTSFKKVWRRNRLLIKARTLKAIVWSKERSFLKNLIVAISHFILLPFPLRFLAQSTDCISRYQNNKGFHHVFHSCDNDNPKNSLPKSIFNQYVDVPFEGDVFKAMAGYDTYLRECYGDYMELPPIEKRVSTHTFNVYWK